MSAGRFAEKTSVTSDRSRSEIERTLRRYGASGFAYSWEEAGARIMFRIGDRTIRFTMDLPQIEEFGHTPTGKVRAPAVARVALEQAERQRWRALALVIKAKLEAVTSGITTIEDEFLAWTVLSDGSTVSERIQGQLESGGALQLGSGL